MHRIAPACCSSGRALTLRTLNPSNLNAINTAFRCAACQFTIDKLQELLENSTALDTKVQRFLQKDFNPKPLT